MADAPYNKRIFWLNMVSSLLVNVYWGVTAMVPVFLRKPDGFNGSELQTVISTSVIPFMATITIFLNEAYRRMPKGAYIFMLWILGFVPLGVIGWCRHPWSVVLCMLMSAFGMAAITPVSGDILRKCFPESCRGRVYSLLSAIGQGAAIILMFLIGQWMDFDDQAFRIYMPISAMAIGLGCILIYLITRETDFRKHVTPRPTERLRSSLYHACMNMIEVLKKDRSFRRFEIAFFVYGTGWMICHAILTFVVVDRLKLTYSEVANTTHVIITSIVLVGLVPAGYLVDRIGAFRMAAWSYLCMALYALGLIVAFNKISLAIAVVFSGLGMTGIHLAWMIGPMTLARDPTHGAHYIAIHATLVGLRAMVGQLPAVLIYKMTGHTEIPLAIAILFILIGAALMKRLADDPEIKEKPKPAPVPVEAVSGAEHDAMS